MLEGQPRRVQQQARCKGLQGGACVQRIAQDGVAQGSQVSLEISLTQLPLLPGVLELVRGQFFTRARRSNRAYVEPGLKLVEPVDASLLEVFFDAQTSGGLLVSVAGELAGTLIQQAKEAGCLAYAAIGTVLMRQEKAIIVKN